MPHLSPTDRMERMRRTFEKDRGVLAEDYEFFTGIRTDEPKHLSKDRHTSEEVSGLQSQEPS